jgi:hypothetical protein
LVQAKSLLNWWQEAGALALADPAVWALLGASIIAGLAGRQLCILIATLLVAALGATLLTANAASLAGAPLTVAVVIQMVLVLAAWEHRGRHIRLARALAASEAAGADLAVRLEREVRWRRSAEEIMPPSPEPPSRRPPEAEIGELAENDAAAQLSRSA